MQQLRRRRESSPRGAYLRLLGIGLFCWLVGSLACRPAWSPDGTKILFSAVSPDGNAARLVIHDLEKGETTTLGSFPNPTGDAGPVGVAWLPDSRHYLAVLLNSQKGEDADPELLLGDVRGIESVKRIRLDRSRGGGSGLLLAPPLVRGDYAYLGGKEMLRVHLTTLELEYQRVGEIEEVLILFGRPEGQTVFFMGQEEAARGVDADIPVGVLRGEDRRPEIWADLQALGYPKLAALPAVSEDEKTIVIAVKEDRGRGDNDSELLWITAEGVQRRLRLSTDSPRVELINLQLHTDGDRLFLAMARQVNGESSAAEVGVAEVDLSDGSLRFRAVQLWPNINADNASFSSMQMQLSPAGDKIAISTAAPLDDGPLPTGACYIVDLSRVDPETGAWPVTEIKPPENR